LSKPKKQNSIAKKIGEKHTHTRICTGRTKLPTLVVETWETLTSQEKPREEQNHLSLKRLRGDGRAGGREE